MSSSTSCAAKPTSTPSTMPTKSELVKRSEVASANKAQPGDSEAVLRSKAFANANMPEFSPYKHIDVPNDWRVANHQFLVVARVNCIPTDYLPRMTAWMIAHLSPLIGRVPTTRDIEAANGINIQDLYLRFALRPIKTFANKDDAHEFAKLVSAQLDCTASVLAFYEDNVVPPYTTTGRVFRDQEVQRFMDQFRKHESEDRSAFEEHVVATYKEIQTLSAKSQEDTLRLQREGKEADVPSNVHQVPGGDTGILRNKEQEQQRLQALRKAIDEDATWYEDCANADDPDKAYRDLIATCQGFVEGFEIKRMTIDMHLNLLREKIERARGAITPATAQPPLPDFKTLTFEQQEALVPDLVARSTPVLIPQCQPIKYFVSPPDGSLHIVNLDDTVQTICEADRCKYRVFVQPQGEQQRHSVKKTTTTMSRFETVLDEYDMPAVPPIDTNELKLHNYNMRCQRAAEQAVIDAGGDPRIADPIVMPEIKPIARALTEAELTAMQEADAAADAAQAAYADAYENKVGVVFG